MPAGPGPPGCSLHNAASLPLQALVRLPRCSRGHDRAQGSWDSPWWALHSTWGLEGLLEGEASELGLQERQMDTEQADHAEKGVGRAEPCSSTGRSCGERKHREWQAGCRVGSEDTGESGAQGEACDNPAGQRKPTPCSAQTRQNAMVLSTAGRSRFPPTGTEKGQRRHGVTQQLAAMS